MKVAGLVVMPAGLFLALAALVLFPDPARREVFVLCGLLVEGLGLGVAIRGHVQQQKASGDADHGADLSAGQGVSRP